MIFPLRFRYILTLVLQFVSTTVAFLAIYDYLLTSDDEVYQSYSLYTVQRYLKVAQGVLYLAEKKSWGGYT